GSKKRVRWLPARRNFSQPCPSLRIPNRFLREGNRPPPARSGHRCVADNANLYVFGGYNPDFDESGGSENEDYPLFRELWRYHFATGTWQQMRTEGYMPRELASMSGNRPPPARSGHRCVADNANLYVFGGYNPDFDESGGSENEDYPLFRELWRYHFATGTWQQMRTEGYMPRELASMSAVLHGNNLLVFGGTGIPFGESNGNDVHVCNVKFKRWSLLSCRGKKPNRIYGQAMAIINGYLYVFGGTTGYIYSTDLHRLDLNTREWIHLKPNNPPDDLPEERYRHEITHDGQKIYILGGGTSWTSYPLDKIHAYNLETNSWEEITTKPHDKIGFPAARRCHSCVQIGSDIFICGGYNGELILGDLWKMNLQTFQWTKLPAVMPEPAYFHCAAVTPVDHPLNRTKQDPDCSVPNRTRDDPVQVD
ncbi:UNVERIFIED_CONTAM: hypothetical protein FKN15_032524, partial [Acipenser sinensis]